jgi:Ran GTPase-activating protein (RanGAP) involved in mRNA processing and transport
MSNELTLIQLFFKGQLSNRISNPIKNNEFSSPFSLNLFDYDLFDEDIQKIIDLIILTDKFNSLNIRLSNTLIDTNTLGKLLRKISLKKQFKSLGFYIKNLNEELLNIFLDFIGKMKDSIVNLKIKIKFNDEKTEERICGKILENLLKGDGSLDNLILEKFNLSSENNMKLLEQIISKNKNLQNLEINDSIVHNKCFSIDISNVINAKISGCGLLYINYLPIDILNISNNNIGKEGIEQLAELISDEKCSLAKLNISNNLIGDEGAIILSQGISKNNSLIAINLSSNHILNSGIIELAKSLKSNSGNKTIKKLNLSKNEIENTGLIDFCTILKEENKYRFLKIDFSQNNYSDRAVIEFGEFLLNHPSILKLTISNISTEENKTTFFNSCNNLNQLKKINLENLDMVKANSESLNNILLSNKNILNMNISNNKSFGAEGLQGLSSGIEHNSKLFSINLSHCNIGDEGAIYLSNSLFKNLDIKEIILIDNKIGEKGTKAIVDKLLGKTSLKILDLSFNKINSKGGFYIGKGLIDAQGIQQLLLGYNKLEDEGCEFIANGLEKNSSLFEINLDNNNISNKGINALCKYLKNNENLMKVSLNGNKISEIDSDFYELFNWVKDIKISENPLNQSGIVRLFQGSEYNRLFKYLKFKYNSEDEYHFKCFNENIKSIDISFNHKINLSLISHILSLKNLSKLNLQMNSIDDKEIKSIVNYIKENNSPIKTLILKNNKITSEGSVSIVDLIKFSKTLKVLDLSYNELKSEGVKKICNGIIVSNSTSCLEQLFLNGNKCNDYCADDIFNLLVNNNVKKLKMLSLSVNFFSNKGIDKILSSLRKNNYLEQLYLGENKIDAKAFSNLVNYLKFNRALKILEIKSSRINDESLNEIIKVFGDDSIPLEKINLNDNNLEFEGIAKFGQYTSKNENLNEIKLMNNKTLKEQQALLISCNSHLIFAN